MPGETENHERSVTHRCRGCQRPTWLGYAFSVACECIPKSGGVRDNARTSLSTTRVRCTETNHQSRITDQTCCMCMRANQLADNETHSQFVNCKTFGIQHTLCQSKTSRENKQTEDGNGGTTHILEELVAHCPCALVNLDLHLRDL